MTASPIENTYDRPVDAKPVGRRQFKKHKVLPRPNNDQLHGIPIQVPRTAPIKYDLIIDTSTSRGGDSASQPASPRTLKHHSKRIGSGPDLPPTPPRHSRKSSSNSSGLQLPSSPTIGTSAFQTPQTASTRPPATPPNQRSPPTPDVTPPQPTSRPRALRPNLSDRGGSRATTADSRTESFKTAREDPVSSEDDESKPPTRPLLGSTKTSQTTVRRIADNPISQSLKPNALGLALSSLSFSSDRDYTPQTKGEFGQFDGDWGSVSEVEQEWDDNLQRVVTIKKRHQLPETPRQNAHNTIILEDRMVTPTNAIKAVRHLPLNGHTNMVSSPRGLSTRRTVSSGPSSTDTSASTDARRASAISTRSTTSTVVEAFLIGAPPQRQRTLRHVRKQCALRDPDASSPSSTTNSVTLDRPSREFPPRTRSEDSRKDSYASSITVNSASSGKARREVRKNGGIPVVVVPDRQSSHKSKPPSLRSTFSKPPNKTPLSASPVHYDSSTSKDVGPVFPRPTRRGRAYSDSDGSDERTIDYPPSVPARSSSLSAPTSRNGSRANSLTAESIKMHNALQDTLDKQPQQQTSLPAASAPTQTTVPRAFFREPNSHGSVKSPTKRTVRNIPSSESSHRDGMVKSPAERSIRNTISSESNREGTYRRPSIDRHEDFLFVKGYSSRNTPFSATSVETNGTALEVSEALAVHMYPHQNSSVLMVDHSNRPSEEFDEYENEGDEDDEDRDQVENEVESRVETHDMPPNRPQIITTGPSGEGPVTPPQPKFSLDDIDSPLRNPRAPPEPPSHPPAINFIPATPSGMTPAYEKLVNMGNYFEATGEKPPRRPSLVRRALNHRRHSMEYPPTTSKPPGFLSRTLSLSRTVRNGSRASSHRRGSSDLARASTYPNADDIPAEENRLHPFWRPQWSSEDLHESDDEWTHDHGDRDDRVFRYPLVDNRPRGPKRSLSEKMKRTFTILPPREEEYYSGNHWRSPDRRTIKRTPSGNLRVMRHQDSYDSLRRTYKQSERPRTAPDDGSRPFWRSNTLQRRIERERRRFSLGSRLEEIHNIPRRISEKRREKRTQELRQKISGPREVRDGVGEVIRSGSIRDQHGSNGRF
ncbi:hypothetical protein G7046_g672 [Stylonectria norvegica]|nr:hypothetical protein G7046_g672 [Stylonectria norvegica]